MRLLTLALLILLASATIGAEAKQVFATVTASSLVARSAPQADAPPVGSLSSGTYVVVQQVQGEWALVGWLVDKKVQSGWVSAQYLSLVSRGGGGSGSSFTTGGGANFDLHVDDTDIHCREGYDGGYSSCEVTVSISYDSDYNGNDYPNVYVDCDVTLKTTDVKQWTASKSESGSEQFYGATESGEITVDFRLSSFDPVVEVRVYDVDCEITDVY